MNFVNRSVSWNNYLQESLNDLGSTGLRRHRAIRVAGNQSKMSMGGDFAPLVNFGSNDYLGLRCHPEIIAASRHALAASGMGSGASPLVTGYKGLHAELEQRLADLEHADEAAVFSSGFACNVGVIPCLSTSADAVLSDQLNHASLIDGCRLSHAHKIVFPHACAQFVRDTLKSQRHRYRRVLIVTESIFSMDGDLAPLAELADIADTYDAGLIVDEAHATGVYGEHGAGAVEELRLQGRPLAQLGTLSKSLGCVGGFASGSKLLVDYIVNRCRSYIYSTALPECVAASAIAAVKLSQEMSAQRVSLRKTSRELREILQSQGWQVPAGDSPIIPVIVGDAQQATNLARQLAARGYFVPAIRPPTVPDGTARLRISLSASHTASEISGLAEAFLGQSVGG